jgi:hypothetical protein
MTTAEFDHRGGLKAEPRTERSRRTVREFWATEGGQELTKSTIESEHFEQVDEHNAWLWVIDSNPSTSSLNAPLPDISQRHPSEPDRSDYSRRRVAVVKMRAVDVLFDEYRSGWAPTPLRHEIGVLPSVLPAADPRNPRGTITLRVVERVAPSVVSDVEVADEAAE